MCGIAAILGPLCSESKLRQMGEAMLHRGPDDFNLWIGNKRKVGFAHTRLSIIDLINGSQPMLTTGNRFILSYNGEIYNYLELQNELFSNYKIDLNSWKTSCDTEVLLYLFQKHGVDCLKKLNGMYAFTIWDEKEKKLFAARDRFGVKPLYYYHDGDNLIIASEIKAILASGVEPVLDKQGFSEYLELQYCLSNRTMFKGIFRLLPGHYLEYDLESNRLKSIKYWEIKVEQDLDYIEDQSLEELNFLIHDSVHLQLRSDVPLGFHLSGGLDSSTICSIGSKIQQSPIKTFTGGFNNEGYSELEYAKFLANELGAENSSTLPTSNNLLDSFKKIIYMLDEPVAGAAIFPQYFLSKLISENSIKVALGGQGGDEIFCGYVRYLVMLIENCIKEEINGHKRSSHSTGLTLKNVLQNFKLLKGYEPLIKRFFSNGIFEDNASRYYHMMKRTTGLENIFCPDFYIKDNSVKTSFIEEFENINSKNVIDSMSIFDIKNHLQSLLHLEDRASMSWSVESRVPFLDHRIVEKVMMIPANKRFANGDTKHIFKKLTKNILPKKIHRRKDKKGFPVPINEWFNGELKCWVKDILLSKKATERGIYNTVYLEKILSSQAPFDRTIWGLLSLEFWFQNFFDKSK